MVVSMLQHHVWGGGEVVEENVTVNMFIYWQLCDVNEYYCHLQLRRSLAPKPAKACPKMPCMLHECD